MSGEEPEFGYGKGCRGDPHRLSDPAAAGRQGAVELTDGLASDLS